MFPAVLHVADGKGDGIWLASVFFESCIICTISDDTYDVWRVFLHNCVCVCLHPDITSFNK